MPNFDGGHYFLTVLAPIRNDTFVDGEGRHRSRADVLREILDCLPTAKQDPDVPGRGDNSPFAKSKRTHLARFVVIDDVVYNGRAPKDAVLSYVGGVNPLIPQPVDRLNRPYLLFAADIDTASGDDTALDSYLTELWNTMGAELNTIFGHCERFTDDVKSAADFCAYIKKCQLETTMPFNDYWADGLPISQLTLRRFVLSVGGGLAAVALGLGYFGHWPWWGWILAGVAVLALTLLVAYVFVTIRSARPFPTAEHSDLKSVLKALYLQQKFVKFVIDNQGVADEKLHADFAAFIDRHKPQDLDTPTQEPGVIRS